MASDKDRGAAAGSINTTRKDANAGRAPPDTTLPVDSKLSARLSGPALPFVGASSAVACHVLAPVPDATPVPITLGVFPWRLQGALRLTVVAKATFSFADGDVAVPIAPDALEVRDVHHKGRPLAHAVTASDRVPWKTAVDVTLLGHACAPAGEHVTEARARFALLHGDTAVFDKSVRVIGDRATKDAAPKPFDKIPIVYERTVGGIGTPSNPIGCAGDDGDLPNVLDLENPYRPAGFGPIPAAWPLRNKRLGETKRPDLDGPVMELPAGFSFAYFQAAPQDQQIPALPPDAVLLLEGMHPERPCVCVTLPCVRAVGAAYGLDAADPDAPSPLPFRVDTLHVDADRRTFTLVFRAYVMLADDAQLERLMMAAGVGIVGHEPPVPARRPRAALPEPSRTLDAPAVASPAPTGTLDLAAPAFGAHLATASADVTLPPPVIHEREVAPAAKRSAAPFFHDLTKLRALADGAPRSARAPGAPPSPEELITLERYAAIAAALDEHGVRRADVLAAAEVDAAVFRKAELHWKRAMAQGSRRGDHGLRDRFDEAYVAAWEAENPDRFVLAHYASARHAERRGLLAVELDDQGLHAGLGMRLCRVWRRRVDADPEKRAALDHALADAR
ncbi:hypothetical protein A7982_13538 [Minicystis rosea]|nr:hypothetical protein A7982_13538 [Minicystis rosea]